VNRGAYAELRDLFAADAVWLGPDKQELHGRDAIGDHYVTFLSELRPTIRIASFIEQGNVCAWEQEVILEGWSEWMLGAIDRVTLDGEGRAVRFAVYTNVPPPA